MSTENDLPEVEAAEDSFLEPGVRWYLFLASAGLVVIWIMLTGKFGILALAPTLLGALGLAAYLVPPNWGVLSRRLRRPLYLMPLLVVGSIMVLELLFGFTMWRQQRGLFEINDLLLCAAVLAYLSGQYRLFSLGSAAVPPDARPRPDRLAGDEPDPRPPALVQPREFGRLGGVILGCVLGGQLLWLIIVINWAPPTREQPYQYNIGPEKWRMLLLTWLIGVGTVVLTGCFRLLRTYRMSADESRMVLQEALWAETRGEQRRQARWLAWARRKANRTLEKEP
jgi:hypothetical protein